MNSFENHLIQQGGATFVYDGDGNRVEKIVAGVTTKYLVATVNPTGYAQVVYETFSGTGITEYWRQFVYGLDRISQYRSAQSGTQKSFYVYDGHGSVRALTDQNGNVTDTYDYDAFGSVACNKITRRARCAQFETIYPPKPSCISTSAARPACNCGLSP